MLHVFTHLFPDASLTFAACAHACMQMAALEVRVYEAYRVCMEEAFARISSVRSSFLTELFPPFTVERTELKRQEALLKFRMRQIPIEDLNVRPDRFPLMYVLLQFLARDCVFSQQLCDGWLFQLRVLCDDLCPDDGSLVDPYAVAPNDVTMDTLLDELRRAALEQGVPEMARNEAASAVRDESKRDPENDYAINVAMSAKQMVDSARKRIKDYKHGLVPTLHSVLSGHGVHQVLISLIASYSSVSIIECT